MFKEKHNYLFIKAVSIIFAVFILFIFQSKAQTSPDAIAIRVMPNQDHLSAAEWYRAQKFSGSPQFILVDGYGGVRDGRTVYVNVANIATGNLYTNIYLISYNQKAEKETVDIFANILSHWKFNINLISTGHCRKNNKRVCMSDTECALGDFCDSLKARVIRDTKRLEDLSSINFTNPPSLSAGSYIPNFSISVWPSWDDALNTDLGYSLPKDPVNDMGYCSENYNVQTCWDEKNKSFVNNDLSLPDSSMVYTYNYDTDNKDAKLCGVFESGLTISNPPPCMLDVCIDIDGDGYGVFVSSECLYHDPDDIDCDDTNDAVLNASQINEVTCFGGIDEDCDGFIDCFDEDCESDPSCLPPAGCMNGLPDPGEECDDGNSVNTDTCTNSCKNAICGDGIVQNGVDQCDDGANGDNTDECYDDCTLTYCGDNITQDPNGFGDNEECDGEAYCTNCQIICTDDDGDGYIEENFDQNECVLSYTGNNDCDDGDANVHPNHAEDCDGLDNNCNGFRDEDDTEESCSWVCEAQGYHWIGSGCCGNDALEGPWQEHENIPDRCNDLRDNDCDGATDGDDDNCSGGCAGTEDEMGVVFPCTNECSNNHDDDGGETLLCGHTENDWDNAGILDKIDTCDPDCGTAKTNICYNQYEEPDINGYETSCDNLDNDCDGEIDDLGQTTCGEGQCNHTIDNCMGGILQTCDPFEGADATETCADGIDNDCQNGIDDGCTSITCYLDSDGDGFGDINNSQTIFATVCPTSPLVYVLDSSDCDDSEFWVNPGRTETCDGLDNNCSDPDHTVIDPNEVDEGCDDDMDGYCDNTMQMYNSNSMCLNTSFVVGSDDGKSGDDCDDDGPSANLIFPSSALDDNCDGLDNNCSDPDHTDEIDQNQVDEDSAIEDCQHVCSVINPYVWLGLGDPYNCCGNTSDEQPYQNNEFTPIDLCDDQDASLNDIDNDCDGLANCADPDCLGISPSCPVPCTFEFTLPCVFP